ncbi:uncharacterized protein JCM6883_004349 [Sporobolomyces salmoneus]|uniref:uncharacterized protein n=1 Tax=Sporobolomyces salmoneus TaxID=183962 RepID=UPI0031755ED6
MSITARHRGNRWKRPNVWLGKLIPTLICIFGFYGYRLVLLEVYPLIKAHTPTVALLYLSWVNFFLGLVVFSYSLVYFHRKPRTNSLQVPAEVQQKRVVFACDEAGEPLRCDRDNCNGSYLSIRTRHCRDCQSCQVGFDHHCSFMDNCVSTSSTFNPFVTFIFYAVLLLVVALVPLAPLQYRAFREVIATTWRTEKMREDWWSRWYSWVGGPVWRYAGAIVLGYLQYPSVSIDRPFLVPGHRVKTLVRDGITYAYDESLYPRLATPTLSTLVLVAFATLIVGIGIGMLCMIILNARKGMSAVQVERTHRYRLQQRSGISTSHDARLRLWIPFSETDTTEGVEGGAVVMVEPDTPLFDFGPMENWKRLMGQNWWDWFVPTRIPPHDDTVVNPSILEHLLTEARKKQ